MFTTENIFDSAWTSLCNGIALNDFDKAGNYLWAQVLGSYLYYLGGVS